MAIFKNMVLTLEYGVSRVILRILKGLIFLLRLAGRLEKERIKKECRLTLVYSGCTAAGGGGSVLEFDISHDEAG